MDMPKTNQEAHHYQYPQNRCHVSNHSLPFPEGVNISPGSIPYRAFPDKLPRNLLDQLIEKVRQHFLSGLPDP